ncbi:cytochrome P450 [Pluteus cervinus]|uniref:Cytochrome P450 n=1 Tax=Pluteus cervinus TaxID=181527 RepID=A0ACD3B5L0_9AGAR|nr:cytochrome P450 [Pluteus cervinus]
MRGNLYDYAKESSEKGEDKPMFERDILESAASATFFSAGVDTTGASMQMAILMLATHPEVQQEAQEEIRQVLGHGQLPTLADRSSLPYTEGCFIPRGTLVITNIWAMTRNETLFPEPEIFRPERIPMEQSVPTLQPSHSDLGDRSVLDAIWPQIP